MADDNSVEPGDVEAWLDCYDVMTDIERARRAGRPLCVAMLDMDGLKAINDRHGHPVEAEVHQLREAASAVDGVRWRQAHHD